MVLLAAWASLGCATRHEGALRPPVQESTGPATTAMAVQGCSELRVEYHAAGFWIEKPACPDGGLSIPRQYVVPSVRVPCSEAE